LTPTIAAPNAIQTAFFMLFSFFWRFFGVLLVCQLLKLLKLLSA